MSAEADGCPVRGVEERFPLLDGASRAEETCRDTADGSHE